MCKFRQSYIIILVQVIGLDVTSKHLYLYMVFQDTDLIYFNTLYPFTTTTKNKIAKTLSHL